ncbi:outer membrane protein assembly factor BamE [Imbroritus primus]|uniref:outer membrane protein assembly factor BamE n=1 Tax=Imbroritus primus TaxID=3058603 RepID=UPI003D1617AD
MTASSRKHQPTVAATARLILAGGACALLLGACSTYNSTSRSIASSITPYRIDIVQGNFVSREAVSQLREGMTREQVRFLLGTPLLNDVFHANQWDYVFAFRRGSSEVVQQRRYTVQFDGDRLVKFGGDELPSEYELIAEIDGIKRDPDKVKARPATPAADAAAAPAVVATPVAESASAPAVPLADGASAPSAAPAN